MLLLARSALTLVPLRGRYQSPHAFAVLWVLFQLSGLEARGTGVE